MNYWIFAHKSEDTSRSFSQLIELKNWGFRSSRPTANKINMLNKGDVVIFYIGGAEGRYFSGEAKLTSSTHKPTRGSLGSKNYVLDAMVDFDYLDMWSYEKIDLTQRSVREKLGFIKNKDNWGMSLGQSIISITEKDYKEIKSLLTTETQTELEKKVGEFEQKYPEGAEKLCTQTKKERDPKLREAAIRKYGRTCMVCEFNFDDYYGKEFADSYIEVHHTKLLSDAIEEIETDIKDVIVVCSNCHRVIHRKRSAVLDWMSLRRSLESKEKRSK